MDYRKTEEDFEKKVKQRNTKNYDYVTTYGTTKREKKYYLLLKAELMGTDKNLIILKKEFGKTKIDDYGFRSFIIRVQDEIIRLRIVELHEITIRTYKKIERDMGVLLLAS